jgi:hypothetical protein
MGIKNGVNLKLLSLCMGHARTQMTEHYIMEAGLTEQVKRAAWQVACGSQAHLQRSETVGPATYNWNTRGRGSARPSMNNGSYQCEGIVIEAVERMSLQPGAT